MKLKVGLLVTISVMILSACVIMQSPQVDSERSVQSMIGENVSVVIDIPGHDGVKALSVELAYCPDFLVLTNGEWQYSEKPFIVDFNHVSKRGVVAFSELKNLTDGEMSIRISLRCLMIGEADLGVYIKYSDGVTSVTEYLDWGVINITCNHSDDSGSRIVHVDAVAPTIDKPGIIDHWMCELCKAHFKDQQGTEGDVDGWWMSYFITYYLYGGSFTSEPVTFYSPGTTIEVIDPIKDDGLFQGWYLDEFFTKSFDGNTQGLEGTINLHAKWDSKYLVTFNGQYLKVTLDGHEIESKTFVIHGAVLLLEKKNVEGYHLGDVWANSPGVSVIVEGEYTVTDNTDFQVTCDRILSISFNKNMNDATGSEETIEWYNGLRISLDEKRFISDDYRVIGWSTTSEGVVEYTSDNPDILYSHLKTLDTTISGVQLYAVWGEKIDIIFGIEGTIVYNGSEQTIFDHLTISGLQNGDSISESNISIVVMNLDNNDVQFRDAGSYRITVGVSSIDPTYKGANSIDISMEKAELRVGLNITSMIYGSQLNESDIVMNGFVGNDGRSAVSGSLEIHYPDSLILGDNKASLSGYHSNNYDIVYDDITIRILSRELSVSWPETSSFTYNGMPQCPEPVVEGLIPDGTSYSVIVENGDSRVVGDYTARLSISGDYSSFYTIPVSKKEFQFSIVKGTHPDTSVEVIQRIGSAVEGVIDLPMLNLVDAEEYIIKSASIESNDIVGIDIGDDKQYWYRFKGYSQAGSVDATVVVSSKNYNDFNVVLKFITIDKEPVTITDVQIPGLDNGSKVYDGTGLTMSPNVDAIDSNNNPHSFPVETRLNILSNGQFIDSERTINDPLDAGEYELIVSVDSPDYSGTKKIYFKVLCKELTINGLRVNDKDYDGTDSASIDYSVIHLDGLLGDDVSTVTLDASRCVVRFSSSDAGFNIPIIFVELYLKGDGYKNYELKIPESVTSTINKATPVCNVLPVASSISYGDLISSSTLTGGSFGIEGIDVIGYYSWDIGDDVRHAVGTHPIPVTFHPGAGFENNFNETSVSVDVIVEKRVLNVEWSNGQYVYDGALKTVSAVATNVVDNEPISFVYSNNQKTDAGSYVARITGFEVEYPNYTLGSEPITCNWTIEKADYFMEGVVFSETEFEYDGQSHSPILEGLPTGADNIALEASYSGSVRYVKDSGTLFTATFSTSSNNYNVPKDMSVTLSVIPRAIDVAWGSINLTYSGVVQAPSATINNLVDGDKCAIIISGGKVDVGVYEAAIESVDNENYSHSSESIEFSIIPAPLTIRANDVTVTYGDVLSPRGVSISGFVGDQDEGVLSGSPEYHYEYAPGSPVSDDENTYTIKVSGFTNSNYDIGYVPGTLTVIPRIVVLSWSNDSLTYNDQVQVPSVDVTGLYGDDECNATVIGGQTDAGEYVAVVTGLDNRNYALPDIAVHSFTIGKATPMIGTVPTISPITYGDSLSASKIDGGSVVFGNTVIDGSFAWSQPQSVPVVGSSEFVITFTPDEDYSKNFTGIEVKVLVSVSPRIIEVDWSKTESFVYDGTEKTISASITNAVGDDVITFTYSKNKAVKAGVYNAEIISIVGDRSDCYTLVGASVTKEWAISKADYDMSGISFEDGEFIYNGSEQSLVISGKLPVGVDSIPVSVTYSPGIVNVSESGTVVTATFHTKSDNYNTPASLKANVSILPKEVGLVWSDDGFVYNGSIQIPSATASGLVGKDSCNVTVEAEGKGAGRHTATAVSLDNGNYALPDSRTMIYEILPKGLKVIANDHAIIYGESASGNGVEYSGFIEGEGPTVLSGELVFSFDYTAGDDISGDGVVYTITPGGLGSSDYSITYVPGNLTVLKKEIGIAWSDEQLVYNGTAQAPVATATGLFEDDSCVITVTGAQVDAGDHQATATSLDNGNYCLPSEVTHDFTIGKATVSFSSKEPSVSYSKDMAFQNSVSGLVQTDNHSYSVEDSRFSVSGNGTVTTTMEPNFEDVTVVVTLTIADPKNYSETVVSYTLTIKPDEGNIFAVQFRSQDGADLLSTVKVYKGSDVTYPENNPVKESDVQFNYTFVGWNDTMDSEVASDNILKSVSSDMTVYAAFSKTLRSYTITFVNGAESTTQTVEYGKVPVYEGDVPTKAPTAQYTFTFSAWGPTLVAVTGDATYTAQYSMTVNTYTIRWMNGGDVIETDLEVPYGTMPAYNGTTPQKAADERYTYAFSGWLSSKDAVVGVVSGDVSYVAQFTSVPRLYIVQFVSEGVVLSKAEYEYGSDIIPPSDPEKNSTEAYTYSFAHWVVDGVEVQPNNAKVEGDMTYEAEFNSTLRTYDITFMNGDTPVKTETLSYGDSISKPENPSKAAEGGFEYKFESWNGYKDGMTVTGDVVFNAIFSTSVSSITVDGSKDVSINTGADLVGISKDVFSENKGSVDSFSVSMTEGTLTMDSTAFGSMEGDITIQINQIKGADFTPEQKDKIGDSPLYAIDIVSGTGDNITSFNDGEITITLPYDGGEGDRTVTVWCISGDELEEFIGNYHGGYVTFKTTHLSEYSIVNTYSVTFEGHDPNTVVSGSVVQAPPSNPIKSSDLNYTYEFCYWVDQNGNVLKPGTIVSSDLTFTPVFSFTVRTYEVTWKVDNDVYLVQTLPYDSNIVAPAGPSKTATAEFSYSFNRWNGYSPDDKVDGPKSYTAVFDSITNRYSVVWMNGEQVFSYSDDVAYGTRITGPEGVPVKASDSKYSYTFKGWKGFSDSLTVSGDMVFEAEYTSIPAEYDVTFTVIGGPTSVVKPSDMKVKYGQTVTLSVQSITGYNVSVRVDGSVIQGSMFTMPDRSVQVTIEYTQIQNPGSGSGGSSGGGLSGSGSSGGSGSGGSSSGTPSVTVPPNIGNLPMEGGSATVKKDVVNAAIKENKDIGFESDSGKVVLPVSVLNNIGASGGDLRFSMGEADRSKFSEAQANVIGSNNAISIDLHVGFNSVHQLGGKVSVSMPLASVDGKDMFKTIVRYVAENGSTEDMVTSYSNGVLSFETTHFSVFMIVLMDEVVQVEHSITVNVDGAGSASASVSTAMSGTKVTLSYEADEGYVFSHWMSSVEIVDDSFIMVDEDVVIEAVFELIPAGDDGGDDNAMIYAVAVIVFIILVLSAVVIMLRRRT